jgi:hypothetical protein
MDYRGAVRRKASNRPEATLVVLLAFPQSCPTRCEMSGCGAHKHLISVIA